MNKLGRSMDALGAITIGLAQQADNKALLQLEKEVMEGSPEALALYRKAGLAGEHLKDLAEQPPKADACPATKLAGEDADIKLAKEKAANMMYEWKGRNPSEAERDIMKYQLVSMFREKYIDLKRQQAEHAAKKSALQTDQYEKEKKMGLQLKGGHQPMARPEGVNVPDSFRSEMGTLTVEQLSEYGPNNEEGRIFVSVYGDIFDVSDRPDKYGKDGPYDCLTGKDITWGLFTGIDTPEMCNRLYDLFKAKDMGTDKLAGICSWLAWYETEYGKPVGRLEPYTHEWDLPMPPLNEIDDACTEPGVVHDVPAYQHQRRQWLVLLQLVSHRMVHCWSRRSSLC
jgi:predicted heme/steroid binding protein